MAGGDPPGGATGGASCAGQAVNQGAFPVLSRRLVNVLPDSWYLRLAYRRASGRFLRLSRPRTFNDKIQWCKLYYRDPILTKLTDKYEVRQYVVEKKLTGILNDLYGVYDSADDIDFSALPDSFVIKATHGSKMNIICKDKYVLDFDKTRNLLRDWEKTNYFYHSREWAYKNIKPRFVCEKLLENKEYDELVDYKYYCFAGKPEMFFACTNRFGEDGVRYEAFDLAWNKIEVYKGRPTSILNLKKPENFEEMNRIAARLCKDFPFVRVDLYSVDNKTYFGELTFYPDAGMIPFSPDEYNYKFGDLLVLPGKV